MFRPLATIRVWPVVSLTQLAKKGVFGSTLIKKHRYWPRDVNAEMIKAHFEESVVRHRLLPMNLLEDNSKWDSHSFKEPYYIMMLMATYGTIERVGQEQSWTWKSKNTECRIAFQSPELVHNHFKYKHAVNDHNNRRQAPISIERDWSTNWWPHWVFAFLIAITEVTVIKVSINLFKNADIGTFISWKRLSEELINIPYLLKECSGSLSGAS